MAVTKIRKISSWTLLTSFVVSLIVLGMFYFGGIVDPTVEMKEPVYTGLLINWMYVMFGVTIVSTVIFAAWQMIDMFKTDAKSALMTLGVLVVFVVVLFITYSMGDTTPLNGLNADSQKYNIPLWLKVTDMWIYTSCVLIVMIIGAVAWGSLKKVLNK